MIDRYNSRKTPSLSLKYTMRIVLFIVFATVVNLLIMNDAFASGYINPDEVHLNKLNYCRISRFVANDYEPEQFSTTNNLLRNPGQEAMFCGERVIIHGVVLDQNCVPVPDAKVYMWQVGCDGKYPYKPLKDAVLDEMFQEKPGLTFKGNGTATTNNKGEFYFVTVYPKAVLGRGPHVNVRVEHRRIGQIQTRLDLADGKIDYPDMVPELTRVAPIAEEMGTEIYNFEIVIPGEGMSYY